MQLSDIRQDIFTRRPTFGRLYETWHEKTLIEYYAQDFPLRTTPSSAILSALEHEVTTVLGTATGANARAAVADQAYINTADHHGLLHHPYFYTAALARSHSAVRKQNRATVTLPFGGVSMSNDSFPRGCSFHDSAGIPQKVFFKSLHERRLPVYATAPMSREHFIHERERMYSLPLALTPKKRLDYFFEMALQSERVWSQTTYSQQLTALNAVLWKVLFGDTRGDFVYLQIDDITNRLLVNTHLCGDTPVHELLCNPVWREAYVELFSSISGAHTDTTGTHFFWYIDAGRHTRQSLRIHGEYLVTADGTVRIPLEPSEIAARLHTRELLPATALTLLVIHGVEGLACAGGPSQLEYLAATMQAWTTLLARMNYPNQTIPTTNIWCGDNTLATVTSRVGEATELATLFDLLLYTDDASSFIDEALTATSLGATIDVMLPTLLSMYSRQPLSCANPTSVSHLVI